MLKLRGKGSKKSKVGWESSVIDNELLNKKKSKSQSRIPDVPGYLADESAARIPSSLLHLSRTQEIRRELRRERRRLPFRRLQRLAEEQALLQASAKGFEGSSATCARKCL